MPQGIHLFCFAKKGNPKKATPTFALIRNLKRKRRTVRNSLRSNNGPLHRRFHSNLVGEYTGIPSNRCLITARVGLCIPACEHSGCTCRATMYRGYFGASSGGHHPFFSARSCHCGLFFNRHSRQKLISDTYGSKSTLNESAPPAFPDARHAFSKYPTTFAIRLRSSWSSVELITFTSLLLKLAREEILVNISSTC